MLHSFCQSKSKTVNVFAKRQNRQKCTRSSPKTSETKTQILIVLDPVFSYDGSELSTSRLTHFCSHRAPTLPEGSQKEQHPGETGWQLSCLVCCLCAWFISCTVAQRKELYRVIKVVQRMVGRHLPSLEELHSSCCLRNIKKILQDASHPGHVLFEQIHKDYN